MSHVASSATKSLFFAFLKIKHLNCSSLRQIVFKKAFKEYGIKEFDYFMSGMVYFSLGAFDNVPERNMVSSYIHLIKMLDAAHLILERRGRKINATN